MNPNGSMPKETIPGFENIKYLAQGIGGTVNYANVNGNLFSSSFIPINMPNAIKDRCLNKSGEKDHSERQNRK